MTPDSRNKSSRALKIAFLYSFFGLAWILFSDQIILLITEDTHLFARLQTLKGWFFIVLTAVLLFFLVRRDLAVQSKGEHSLRESEKRFRDLLNTIPDLVWLKDLNGVYLSCNHTFERFFGAKEAQIVGKTDYDFVDKDLADFFRYHDNIAMEKGCPSTNEEWITFADNGARALLLTTKVPMYDAAGELIGILGVGRDITELRSAEQKRLQLENQLHQAKKVESIGQLAGGVAHDFNNMLGVIMGRAEMGLRKARRSEPVIGELEEIRKASERSANLTRQLLTFARKQVVSPQVLDVNETITSLLSMLQRLIGENIQLSWHPSPEPWQVKIDPSQIDQILANLCVNARDAIEGTGSITIRTKNVKIDDTLKFLKPFDIEPGEYVQISVIDDGVGIEEAVRDQIFEPFFTTKKMGSGTGLGLASVYGAVKQNDGFIDFESSAGRGTVFNIFLPRSRNEDVVPVITDIKNRNETGEATILLVEDDEMLLDLKKSMLEESGFTVLATSEADSALEIAQEHKQPIDLLITDLIMPRMNGKELSEKLKTIRPRIRVLFMSGYTDEIITSQGVLQQGLDFIQKPVSFEELMSKVNERLGI